jgi:hypothetical protein
MSPQDIGLLQTVILIFAIGSVSSLLHLRAALFRILDATPRAQDYSDPMALLRGRLSTNSGK